MGLLPNGVKRHFESHVEELEQSEEILHEMLETEEDYQDHLKDEIRTSKDLRENTTLALNLIEEIEQLEKEVVVYENMSDRGDSRKEAEKVMNNDVDELKEKIDALIRLFTQVKSDLKQLENDVDAERQDLATSADIFTKLNEANQDALELYERLNNAF